MKKVFLTPSEKTADMKNGIKADNLGRRTQVSNVKQDTRIARTT